MSKKKYRRRKSGTTIQTSKTTKTGKSQFLRSYNYVIKKKTDLKDESFNRMKLLVEKKSLKILKNNNKKTHFSKVVKSWYSHFTSSSSYMYLYN